MPPASQARGGPLHGGRTRAHHREARQRRVVAELLAAGRSVVVDNPNPSLAERAPLVGAARAAGVPVRVDTPHDLCPARNAARPEGPRMPPVGIHAALARFQPPSVAEGFARVDVVLPPGLVPAAGHPVR